MPLINSATTYKKLLIPFSFIIMLIVAYMIDSRSFEDVWKGRAFYLFFLWIFSLEFILGNRSPKPNVSIHRDWARVFAGTFMLMIPTIYIVEVYMFGLNNVLAELGKSLGIGQGLRDTGFINWLLTYSWPLSIEYIIVAISILLGVFLLLDFEGVKQFSISIFLLGMMGAFYMIDTFSPLSTVRVPSLFFPMFPPWVKVSFQDIVPLTSSATALLLQKNLGYAVQMVVLKSGAVQMLVNQSAGFLVYWPCAGVHSLFIYTFVILLFLKGSKMSSAGKTLCLVVGATGTFFANVLRIASIIDATMTLGPSAGDFFHNYYGELFFLGWIIIYLIALAFIQRFLTNAHSCIYTSFALIGLGAGIWLSSRFVNFTLPSSELIVSIAGMGAIVAGIILGIYTYFAYHYKRRT